MEGQHVIAGCSWSGFWDILSPCMSQQLIFAARLSSGFVPVCSASTQTCSRHCSRKARSTHSVRWTAYGPLRGSLCFGCIEGFMTYRGATSFSVFSKQRWLGIASIRFSRRLVVCSFSGTMPWPSREAGRGLRFAMVSKRLSIYCRWGETCQCPDGRKAGVTGAFCRNLDGFLGVDQSSNEHSCIILHLCAEKKIRKCLMPGLCRRPTGRLAAPYVVDWNGDGIPDLLIGDYNGRVRCRWLTCAGCIFKSYRF